MNPEEAGQETPNEGTPPTAESAEVWSAEASPAAAETPADIPPSEALPAAPVVAAPRSSRRGTVLLVLASAFLSAILSAGGTFIAFSLQPHGLSVVEAATGSPQGQVLSLTDTQAVVRVVQQAMPSVVTISTSGTARLGGATIRTSGTGSGFVVGAAGLILTNYHVVLDAQNMTVTLANGKEYAAAVVKTDPAHDLALVHIDATGLTPLPLADSSAAQVGQLVVAIGSPLGEFTESVTQGIVSGLGRSIDVGERNSNFTESLSGLIQTDAAINPGNSGGPLLDAAGNVVGIVTAASSSAQNMGFAVPINQAKSLIAAYQRA